MGFWGRRAAGLATAVLTVLALSSGTAGAADPPGTIEVNRVPVLEPVIRVVGTSAYGVLYRTEPAQGGRTTTLLKPAGRAPYQVPNDFRVLRGDKVYAEGGRYLVIGRTQVQTCDPDLAPLPVWSWVDAAYTSFGWIGTGGRRIHVSAAGCQIGGTGPEILDYQLMAADSQGYVLRAGTDNELVELEYHSYAEPGTAVRIQDGGRNRYPNAIDLEGDQISWVSHDYSEPVPHASYVVRSTTTGGPARVTRVEQVVQQTAINGTGTGWAGCDESVIEGRCSAGSIDAAGTSTELAGSQTIGSDGSRYVVDTYGRSPGLDATLTVSDGAARTRVVTVGLLPPESYSVSVGGGFVAYRDNQTPQEKILHRRRVVETSTGLKLGPQRSAGATGTIGIAQGAAGTAYVEPMGDLWIWRSDGTKTRAYDANLGTDKVVGRLELSGRRLLWTRAVLSGEMCGLWGCEGVYDDHRLMVHDLPTGANTEIGPIPLGSSAALDGDRVVYTDSAQRILQRDLASGTVSEVRGAGTLVTGLDLEGSLVGWATCSADGMGSCTDPSVVVRDAGAAPVVLPVDNAGSVRVTAGRVAFTTNSDVLKTWDPGSGRVRTIGTLSGYDLFDAADGLLGWIGPDGVTRLTPMPR